MTYFVSGGEWNVKPYSVQFSCNAWKCRTKVMDLFYRLWLWLFETVVKTFI